MCAWNPDQRRRRPKRSPEKSTSLVDLTGQTELRQCARGEFTQRIPDRIAGHTARSLDAIAEERAAPKGTCRIHGAATIGPKQWAASLVHDRQRAPVFRRDRVSTAKSAERLRDDRPFDVRDPWLAPGSLEVATVGAEIAGKWLKNRIEARVSLAELIDEHVAGVFAWWASLHTHVQPQRRRQRKRHPF